ncbi:hypothetical protein QTP88_005099 [Uroleucon formosanum]
MCDTSRTASVVAVPPVMSASLPNMGNVNGAGTSPLRSGLNLSFGMKDSYKETKWMKGEIGKGYKIIFSGRTSTRNGVGVILDKEMKIKVVDVERKSDRIIMVKLVGEEKVLNVISAYASQVSCEVREKEEFWRVMDEVKQGIPDYRDVVIGGDMNGQAGSEKVEYERVHGGYGFGERNEVGEKVLDYAASYGLATMNTYFKKREEHYITYKSGGNRSQN